MEIMPQENFNVAMFDEIAELLQSQQVLPNARFGRKILLKVHFHCTKFT